MATSLIEADCLPLRVSTFLATVVGSAAGLSAVQVSLTFFSRSPENKAGCAGYTWLKGGRTLIEQTLRGR